MQVQWEDGVMSAPVSEYEQVMERRGRGTPVTTLPKIKDDLSFSATFRNDLDLDKPIYDVEHHYKDKGCAQAVARDSRFANISTSMIFLNAVYLGVDSDHNSASNLYDASWFFFICENVFCLFFTLELLVRLCSFATIGPCLADGWMRFDGFLVTLMVLETWILMPFLKIFVGDSAVSIPVAPLRLMRLLKLTRMARVMRACPELVTLVKGLARSVRAVTGSLLLVVTLLYTFAILIHMLMKSEDTVNEALKDFRGVDFKTLPNCMWLLWGSGVLLDGFSEVSTPLVFSKDTTTAIAGWALVFFSLLAAVTVLQMLLGVLCEVVDDTTKQKKAAKDVAIMKCLIMGRLREFDLDHDGLISLDELEHILEDEKTKDILQSLNINMLFFTQMKQLLFPRADCVVAFTPLTEVLLMCRGDNEASVETMASGFSYLCKLIEKMQDSFESQVDMLQEQYRTIGQALEKSSAGLLTCAVSSERLKSACVQYATGRREPSPERLKSACV
jgi:hypothetical protein